MGSKKHKKHKSERRERYDDQPFCLEKPPSLKLILKVGTGNSSTPEYASSESPPVYGGIQPENLGLLMDYPERHKKSKKKKKKKDREKKHKHHKEKRRHRDESKERTENEQDESSQEDFSINEDSAQFQSDSTLRYNPVLSDSASPASISISRTPLLTLPLKSPILEPLASEQSPSMSSVRSDSLKSPSSTSDSGREARICVLKVRQRPLNKLLNHLLSLLEKKDTQQFFAWPVSDDIAPGYSNIIANPMDFFTIRSKIDDNKYQTLSEFIDDFRLICSNAIQYNQEDTVYHIAAKKLLHVGLKMLKPGNLVRLKPLQIYLQELTIHELGFDLSQNHDNDLHMMMDSADESMSIGLDEVNLAQLEEEVKRQNIRLENEPKSRFEPYVDDLTAEEVLAQVQEAAAKVSKKLTQRKKANKMGFLRQKKDGTTSMQIIVDIENSCPERIVSLGAFTGKLQNGTGQLHSFREDRRNNAKIVKPLNYGTYCSFAPIYDSRFANLNKEESELVLNTYGDEASSEYAASIIEFTKDSQHGSFLANSLLDFLTNGEHRKTMAKLTENTRQKFEHQELHRTFPNPPDDDNEYEKYKNVKIDFDSLRTLGDVGVNVEFLGGMEDEIKTFEIYKSLENRLENNSELLGKLRQVQNERLSQNLPAHLSNVAHPSEDELELAAQITNNLKEIAKELPPSSIVSPHALRKAMGMSNVGLEPMNGFAENKNTSPNDKLPLNENDATITIPMEIDADAEPNADISAADTSTVPPVDLESELREFLESDTTSLAAAAADDVGIEQMLMA